VIEVRLVEEKDTAELLSLELRNKAFFQIYTGSRDDHFYTLEGQRERIDRAISSAAEDTGYSFVILLDGRIIGIIMLSEVVRGIFRAAGSAISLIRNRTEKGI
jgi:[ribosomal protein S5]-alanine N-acetyltransferase